MIMGVTLHRASALGLAVLIMFSATMVAGNSAAQMCDASCGQDFGGIGVPEARGDVDPKDRECLCRAGYVALHNNLTKVPDWVIEDLRNEQLVGSAVRKDNFKQDPDLKKDKKPRARLSDYRGSGLDRGHQAPARNFASSQRMMDESFYLSNMAPQQGAGFNGGIWRRLEDHVRYLVGQRGRLIVITGPIYEDDDLPPPPRAPEIGGGKVRVPEGFFKIIYDPRLSRTLAFALPNQKLIGKNIRDYRISVRRIEESTSLDIFPDLSPREQRRLERAKKPMWNW